MYVYETNIIGMTVRNLSVAENKEAKPNCNPAPGNKWWLAMLGQDGTQHSHWLKICEFVGDSAMKN